MYTSSFPFRHHAILLTLTTRRQAFVFLLLTIAFHGFSQQNANPAFPKWTSVKSAIHRRCQPQCVLYEGEIYTFNGFAPSLGIENSCEKYNPFTNTWKLLASMPSQSNGKPWAVTHAGVALVGDTVWIVGGRIGPNPGPVTNKVWWYKISTNKWISGPNLPFPVGGGGLARLGRKLHFVGGFDANASCDANHHLVYDLDNPTLGWQNLTASSPMPEPRNHFGTAVLGGKLYVIGGQHGHDGCQKGAETNSVYVYDPLTNIWTKLADFPYNESHMEPGTFALDGKIYVVGGEKKGNMVHSYDPVINKWTELTDLVLPEKLIETCARVLGDTMIVAVGGAPVEGNPVNRARAKTISRTPRLALGFNPSKLTVGLSAGGIKSVETILYNQAEAVSYTINTSKLPSWLLLNKTKGKAQESFEEITLTFNTSGLALGTYTYQLVATAPNYASATIDITLQVSQQGEPPVVKTQYHINAGGKAQNVGGVAWEGCYGTNCNNHVTGGFSYAPNPPPVITGVTSPLNQAIFQSEWTGGKTTGVPVGGIAFSYNLIVNKGDYVVRLYFTELNKNAAGLRVFDVNIEKQSKLIDFDIFKEAGGMHKAIVREFPITVNDGFVTIDFIRKIENAKVSAIEVVPLGASRPTSYWLEAECSSAIGANWQVLSNTAASAGACLAVQNGLNSTSSAPTAVADRVSFDVSVASAGSYHIFSRVIAPNGNDNSFWVRVDGGRWVAWQITPYTSSFDWREVQNSPFSLSAGTHTIDFAYREDGTLLDKLFISSSAVAPTGLGQTATNCSGSGGSSSVARYNTGEPKPLSENADEACPDCDRHGVMVFPNPGHGIFTVRFSGDYFDGDASCLVYNLQGELVKKIGLERSSSEMLTFNLENVAPGIYFLQIMTKEGLWIKRIEKL